MATPVEKPLQTPQSLTKIYNDFIMPNVQVIARLASDRLAEAAAKGEMSIQINVRDYTELVIDEAEAFLEKMGFCVESVYDLEGEINEMAIGWEKDPRKKAN